MGDCTMLDKNLNAVMQPLTEKEESVKTHIQQEYFSPLKQPHWEDAEVKQYWKELGRK